MVSTSPVARLATSLTRHTERLYHALEDLRQRLHDEVARTVGQSVADVVGEFVRSMFGTSVSFQQDKPEHDHFRRVPQHTRWEKNTSAWLDDDLHERRRFHDYDDEERIEPSIESFQLPDRSPSRLQQAVASGCQFAGSWLRRGGKGSLLAALGLGLLVGVAGYALGPAAAIVAGLAASTLNITAMTDAFCAGVAALVSMIKS